MEENKKMVKEQKTGNAKKAILGLGGAALITLSAFAGAGLTDDSAKINSLNEEILALQAIEPIIELVPGPIEYVDKEVIIKEIEFQDNENLVTVMSFLQDEVDEDLTVEYILFEMDAKIEAEAWINNKFIGWLSDEEYFDNGELFDQYRKSEVSVKKIYDAEIVDRDVEDKDLELSYEVKLRAKESGEDQEYFSFKIDFPFDNGKLDVDDIEVAVIEE